MPARAKTTVNPRPASRSFSLAGRSPDARAELGAGITLLSSWVVGAARGRIASRTACQRASQLARIHAACPHLSFHSFPGR